MIVVRREGGIKFAMEDERPRGLLAVANYSGAWSLWTYVLSFTFSSYIHRSPSFLTSSVHRSSFQHLERVLGINHGPYLAG